MRSAARPAGAPGVEVLGHDIAVAVRVLAGPCGHPGAGDRARPGLLHPRFAAPAFSRRTTRSGLSWNPGRPALSYGAYFVLVGVGVAEVVVVGVVPGFVAVADGVVTGGIADGVGVAPGGCNNDE